jgi:hypothetical protein
LYSSLNKIGSIRIIDTSVGHLVCDAGKNTIISMAADSYHPGIIYGGTDSGEILVFETTGTSLKIDQADCKLLGRIQTSFYDRKRGLAVGDSKRYELKALKGQIGVYTDEGLFELHNTTDIHATLLDGTEYAFHYKPKVFNNLNITR